VETRAVGRGTSRSSNAADLWEWCKWTATDDGAADIETYIRRDDVRRLLQLRNQKMSKHYPAVAAQGSSRLQQGLPVSHYISEDPVVLRKDSPYGCNPSLLNGSRPGSVESYPGYPTVRCSSVDASDSVSVGSHKDSGYRSEDDRQSGKDSATGSPTSDFAAVGEGGGTKFPVASADVPSICSSFESLFSVQSSCSLPVAVETSSSSRIRTIPEGLPPLAVQDHPSASSSSNAARLRQHAKKLFSRPAGAICRHRQPVKPDNAAAAAVNSKCRPDSTASCRHREVDFVNRPGSSRQFPGSAGGYVRHAESEPAINRLAGAAELQPNSLEDQRRQKPVASFIYSSAQRSVLPPTDQSSRRDQSKSNALQQRVLGQGYLRDTGVLPSLWQPTTASHVTHLTNKYP